MHASAAAPCRVQLGWSSISITPDAPVQLAGQFYERISESVHDPCMATVLAVEGQDEADQSVDQAVLVSCNLVSIGEQDVKALREAVAKRLPELTVEKISVHCTHSHTSPSGAAGRYPTEGRDHVMLPEAYARFWLERVTEAVVQAWNGRQPGAISHALAHAVLGWPRRPVYADGSAVMYGKTNRDDFRTVEGPSDPGVETLFTWNEAGELTGIAAAVGCPAQVVENERFVSADYWHPATQNLRAHFGEHVQVLGIIAAAGDQSPRDMVRRGRGEPNMRQVEGMNELGRRLANAIIDAHDHSQSPRQSRVIFEHHVESIDLPAWRVSERQYEQAKAEYARLMEQPTPEEGSREQTHRRRHVTLMQRYEKQQDDDRYTMELHTIRLGDLAFVTNPFELFLSFGMQIRARSLAEQTFVIQLANAKGQYLPTQEAIDAGGYSATGHGNLVGPAGGQVLVERTVARINSLFQSPDEPATHAAPAASPAASA